MLIYLADKRRALEEAHRVLRPGGRLSIFEPINSYAFPEPDDRFFYYDVGAVRELAAKVKAHYRQVARDDTLTDFDERDLVAWSEDVGFAEVHVAPVCAPKPRREEAWSEAPSRISGLGSRVL